MESFGPYRIEGELGRGPSGVVYRARDTAHDDRVVALKIVAPQLCADPAFRERFHRDAAVLGAVREPYVVPVHGVGEIGGRLYVDMRLVRGPSLAATLAAGPLEEARGRQIAGQIGSAMESLRRGGLAPRPVAAQDVLLTGVPGRAEFVQLVGLGLGRAPVDPRSVTPPEQLVRHPAGWAAVDRAGLSGAPRRSRRWPVLLAAAVAVAVLATVAVVALRGPGGPAGYRATIPAVGAVDIDATVLDGEPVVLTANSDGSVGIWDPGDGQPAAAPIAGAQAVRVIPVQLAGRASVAVVHADTTVVLYDLERGTPVGEPIGEPAPEIARRSARFDVIDGSDPVLVRGRTNDEGFAFAAQGLTLPDAEPFGPGFTLGSGFATSTGEVVERRPAVVQVDDSGTVFSRDLATGQRIGTPSQRRSVQVTQMTTGVRGDGTPVAVVGSLDNVVRVLDLHTGDETYPPRTAHGRPPTGLLTGRVDDRPVLVSTAADTADPASAETRFWDLDTGDPIGGPLRDHPLSTGVAGIAEFEATTVLFGVDEQRRFTVWEASRVMGSVMS